MKSLKRVLVFILAMLISLPLIWSCGDDTGDTDGEKNDPPCTEHVDEDNNSRCDKCDESLIDPDNDTEPDEVMLIEDGEAKFQFVLKDGSSDLVVSALKKLTDKLDALDVSTEVVGEDSQAIACEVIIGAVFCRGSLYEYDMYSLGMKGYAIKVIDGKVIIVGGSDDALTDALEIFEEDFLGISRKTKELTTVKVKESQSIETIQDDYRVTSIKINGNDIKGYTIAADSDNEYTYPVALELQNALYQYAGYRLKIVPVEDADKSIVLNLIENSGEGDGYALTVEENSIVFTCEFPDKIGKEVSDFFTKNVSIASGEVNFTAKAHNAKKNMRDIYYSQFGAKGNGETDDFMAIKACHDYANKWGHNVFADKGKTYYIGKETDGLYISVKTNVDWQNCSFIFDDSKIDIDDTGSNGKKLRGLSIFQLESDYSDLVVTENFAWVTKENSLKQGTTPNIGWAPGYVALINIQTNTHKVFIRYGPNADEGDYPHELLLVDAEGNVDPSTPLSWDYEKISSASMKRADDTPITVGNAKVLTISSRPSNNAYNAFTRNISVYRSNVTVTNLDHTMTDDYIYRTPYQGFIYAGNCTNVEFSNIMLQAHDRKYENGVISGTYEIGGYGANDVRYKNCRIKNFFFDGDPNNTDASGNVPNAGQPNTGGCMGTNYMRNLLFEDCFLTSFDAHKGLGNVTLRNSTFEHINYIGCGDILMENVTVYVDSASTAIILRADYGSSWKGNLTMRGITLKYSDDLFAKAADGHVKPYIGLIKVTYYQNFNFGYDTSLPSKIILDDINVYKYSYKYNSSDGSITETEIKLSKKDHLPVHLVYALNGYGDQDISKPGENAGGDNPYAPPEIVEINNCDDVVIYLPPTAQFSHTKVYADGRLIDNWKPLYGAPIG